MLSQPNAGKINAVAGGVKLSLLAVFSVFMAGVILAYGAPSITYNSPISDNTTTNYNWVYVNITSNETLNQSILEWGNASGLNNISMFNASSDNLIWFVNMTGLSAGAYNYTVFAQNISGDWNQSVTRFVTVSAISACQNITVGNVSYVLIQDINSSGTCFNILANNVTINGAGYTINYSQSATGYAVNNSLGYNRTTIKNLNIVQGNASVSNAYAIFASGMVNGTLTNSTITISGDSVSGVYLVSGALNTISNNNITASSGSSGDGIRFSSSSSNAITTNIIQASGGGGFGVIAVASNSNTFTGNNITALSGSRGFHVNGSALNNISGGSIIAPGSVDYGVADANSSNNFRNTNFTAARNISFFDAASFFNYNNETSGGIWLKTNVSAQTNLTRTLISINNNLVQWNDSNSTSGILANYNITGLLVNTTYYIYNTSAGNFTRSNITSDASGGLKFTIALNGNTEIAVDRPPIITVNAPTNGSYFNSSSFAALVLNITTNEPASWCGFSLNGTTNVTMNGTLASWNYTGISGASEGLNNITFFCNDSRGNIGNSSTIYFTKDTQKPDITVEPACDTRTSSSMRIFWNVSNVTNNYVYYKISGSLDSLSVESEANTSAPKITLSGLTSSKTYAYTVHSCDLALNCDDSIEYTCSTSSSGTTTDDDSSSGGGGGDSSSGLSKSWVSISAGSTAVMSVSSSSVDVTEIIFKVTQALSRAKITVSKLSGKPSGTSSISSGSVYQYVSITPENITNDKITSATISFRVNSTWMSSNAINSSTIALFRYSDSQWAAIPTHYISTSGGFATYLAETPGFSYFAIVGNAKSAPQPPATAPAPPPTSNNITNQSNPSSNASFNIAAQSNNSTSIEQTVSESTSTGPLIFIIIAAVVILSALVYYNKKPKSESSTAISKKPLYTFKHFENNGGGDLVYKAPPKEEKVKYEYKPKK